jgi:lactoylglutathione lyase
VPRAQASGHQAPAGRFLDFRDPWVNRIEIVGYDNIQFTKAQNVLRGMGLAHLQKNASALKELAEKDMAP